MYATILDIADWTIIALMGLSFILLLYKIIFNIYGLFPDKKFPDAKKNHRYAILIPARYESKVISRLLDSLNKQDYPKELFDTYVIIESEKDPTFEICKKYDNVTAFVRPNLNVKSKGGALDQIIKHLIEINKAQDYEAYFIFDADNIAAPNFLTEMNKTYDAGYGIALSYRNSINWNDGWVASCSGLTFTMLNTMQNKCRARFTQNVLVSGTGFYISAKVINDLGGWPFQCLTEDVEISNYAVLNDIKGAYNANTQFFDEQPINLKISWNQRIRWVKGHMQVGKKYNKKLWKSSLVSKENKLGKLEFALGIIPLAVPLASIIVYAIFTLVLGIVGVCLKVDPYLWRLALINFGVSVIGMYTFLALYTVVLIFAERKHIDLTTKNAVVAVFMNPFFMGLYIPIAIAALFKKEVKWKPIERKADIEQEHYNELIVNGESTDTPNEQDISKQLDAEFIKK